MLSLLLAQLYVRASDEALAEELELLLESATVIGGGASVAIHPLLEPEAVQQLALFAQTEPFKEAQAHIQADQQVWTEILHSTEPEKQVPADLWANQTREFYPA